MNLRNPAMRLGLLPAGIAIALTPAFAMAQEQSADASTTTLDRIEITGSRIRSVDLETAQPVFTVSSEAIKKSGLVSVGDILQNLSISGTQNFSKAAVLTSNSEQGGQYVNLYNLGENRTLVLVNGKRWTSSINGYTDLSTIPSALIDHIEVLKDGASAIYGSDAVAGVVNIILKKNFDGAEASVLYGQNARGDGAKTQYSLTLGATGERSSLVFGASYSKEDPVWAKDRELTRNTYGSNHVSSGLSATGPWGRFVDPESGDSMVLNHTGSYDGNGVGADSRDIANYHSGVNTDDRYNSIDQMMWNQGSTNKSVFASGSYDITDNIKLSSTAMYSERESKRQIAGYPLSSDSQPNFPVYVDKDSYYNPLPGNDLSFYRRITELPRVTDSDVKNTHFDVSLEGAFDVGSHGWNWDVGFNYNKYDVTQTSTGNINLLALQKALGPSFLNSQGVVQCGTPSAPLTYGTNIGLGQCVPFNVLGGPSASTADALKYINSLGQATQRSENKIWTANITGGLFDMPLDAGEFAFAAGVEHREVSGYDYPDQASSNGFTTDLAAQPTEGRYQTNEAYLEFMIPVLKDLPFAKELSFDVAGRYSNYDRFGNTTNTKYSFTWKPFDDLLVRGTYGKGFRAPTLGDTFGGGSQTFDSYLDPCDAVYGQRSNPIVAAHCGADGLAGDFRQTDNAGVAVDGPSGTQGIAPFQSGVGNSELEPEYSRTRTVGLVYSPSYVPGLDISVDWYRISISNVITAISAGYVLDQCYTEANTAYCDQFTRNADGQVVTLNRGNTNLGKMQTEGYNIGVNYRLPEFGIGQFVINLDANYLANYRIQSDAGAAWEDYAGYWNFPRVRATLGVNWSKGDLSASWNLRYYGGFRDYCWDTDVECNDPNYLTANPGWGGGQGANKKGSISFQDVSVSWNAPWDGSVTFGVRNIWDKQPPITYSADNSSTAQIDPMLDYDRYLFMQYTQRF